MASYLTINILLHVPMVRYISDEAKYIYFFSVTKRSFKTSNPFAVIGDFRKQYEENTYPPFDKNFFTVRKFTISSLACQSNDDVRDVRHEGNYSRCATNL